MRVRIENRANKILANHGITSLPVPVDRIAAAEGVTILRQSTDRSESGFALSKGSTRIIGVNQTHNPKRQRFTIAHELGHILLHHSSDTALTVDHAVRINFRDDVSSLATNEQEIEANAFAAALLMPQHFVESEVLREYEAGVDPDRLARTLAKLFAVSDEAMGYRLMNLGLTST